MATTRRSAVCLSARSRKCFWIGWVVLCLGIMVGCAQNMYEQPRYEPLEQSDFFPDGRSSRHLVEGTVPRGMLREDLHRYEGRFGEVQEVVGEEGAGVQEQLVDSYPFPIGIEDLERGQERYNIYCAPCHGLSGNGDGMIVQRGFSPPPSFHTERLREVPLGHYYDVITNGFGRMFAYGYAIAPDDRWRIVAYIQALQLSQNATLEDVPAEERQELEETQP